jgi:hypothetical protein
MLSPVGTLLSSTYIGVVMLWQVMATFDSISIHGINIAYKTGEQISDGSQAPLKPRAVIPPCDVTICTIYLWDICI